MEVLYRAGRDTFEVRQECPRGPQAYSLSALRTGDWATQRLVRQA